MSHSGSTASSVKRHIGTTSNQWTETSEMPSDISQHSLPSHHHHGYDPEWEAKEELRLRELEEARARAAQMEKTMRWWSDCTANWREKWSKVRTERNKVREEARVLRGKLEAVMKECNTLKREKQEFESEMERQRKEIKILGSKLGQNEKKNEITYVTGQVAERITAERDISPAEKPALADSCIPFRTSNLDGLSAKSGQNISDVGHPTNEDLEFIDKLLQQKNNNDVISVSGSSIASMNELRDKKAKSQRNLEEISSPVHELTEQKIAMLQLKLDEASKTIAVERQERSKLMKNTEKLQSEFSQLRAKYEDLKKSRQDTMKELNQMKSEHQDELESIRLDLEDEANTRTTLDQRLSELREELERLQAENAAEWGRRERLETEKLALERENKKLRTQIEDLEERLERKTKQMTTASDFDVKALQMELHEKNKELADLKHAHNKIKKVLQDKSTELAHALRRSEQYEAEVKKLRGRIEELKKYLAAAEDDVDSATNNIRKLQRSNDELQEQVEGLQVQVEHLQSRLKEATGSSPPLIEEPPKSCPTDTPCDKQSSGGSVQ